MADRGLFHRFIVDSSDAGNWLSGALSRAVVFLTLFSFIMVFIFVVAGYQHFQDDSVDTILKVLILCDACQAVLCVILLVSGIIGLLHDFLRHAVGTELSSDAGGLKKIRHLKYILLSVIAFALSAALLCAAMAITLASRGMGG